MLRPVVLVGSLEALEGLLDSGRDGLQVVEPRSQVDQQGGHQGGHRVGEGCHEGT